MRTRIVTAAKIFFAWVLIFVIQKPFFLLIYQNRVPDFDFGTIMEVISHGLTLDMSIAGYLTAIPTIILIASVWSQRKWISTTMRIYIGIMAFVVSSAFVVNIALYSYWGFPLDFTPLFYFFSSPKDTLASATPLMMFGGLITIAACWIAIYAAIAWAAKVGRNAKPLPLLNKPIVATLLLTLQLGALLLPIRGGVTVSTANTGKAYFSKTQALNHAAVNPVFSLLESIVYQENFSEQYRFMDSATADRLFSELRATNSEASPSLLANRQPDVYIIILESFSSALFQTEAIPELQRIAQEGVFFENIYANSFRTDRGILSILSGFPAQPTMSLMRHPDKTAVLPSICGTLKNEGYNIKYYYGGDADFTNMRSYLVNQGFETIISDTDFPIGERLSKWGVFDDKLFTRIKTDLTAEFASLQNGNTASQPILRVLQTSSSHEPFDVPYQKLTNERLNAFAYTDSCVGEFVDWLKNSNQWDNSLVILIPDHQGCWPEEIANDNLDRYHIPLIFTGGVLLEKGIVVSTIGSQHDLAATLLGQLGIDHSKFTFSKDLLSPNIPHFAFFTLNDIFGMITEENQLIFDNRLNEIIFDEGAKRGENLLKGQAYLQKLYDTIDKL